MCAKRQRRSSVLLQIREETLEEWIRAKTSTPKCAGRGVEWAA
jgi:hypothetical protein